MISVRSGVVKPVVVGKAGLLERGLLDLALAQNGA
jgi:hypothetical protein